MARLSYQQVRYRLLNHIKEQEQTTKDSLQGYLFRTYLEDLPENVTIEELIDAIYSAYTSIFSKRHNYTYHMRKMHVDIINTICEGNSFRGATFHGRVREVAAHNYLHKAIKQKGAEKCFNVLHAYALNKTSKHLDEIQKLFQLNWSQTAQVNFNDGKEHEEAFEARRKRRQEYSGPRPKFSGQRTRRHQSHWSNNFSAQSRNSAYQGEKALNDTTYDKVLGISIADIPESKIEKRKFLLNAYKAKMKLHHLNGSTKSQDASAQISAAWRVAQKINDIEGFRG